MDVRLFAAGPGGGRRPVGADSFRPLMWQPSRSLTSGCNPLARHSAPVIICMASRRLWIGKINKTPVDVSTVKVSDTCPSGAEGVRKRIGRNSTAGAHRSRDTVLRVEGKKERPTGGASWIEWAVADPTGDTFVTTCGAQKPSVTGRML